MEYKTEQIHSRQQPHTHTYTKQTGKKKEIHNTFEQKRSHLIGEICGNTILEYRHTATHDQIAQWFVLQLA